MEKNGTTVRIQGADAFTIDSPGLPLLGYRVVRFLLPPNTRVTGVVASTSGRIDLAHDVRLATSGPRITNDGGRVAADALPLATGSATQFPDRFVHQLGTGTLDGYMIASFAVYPVRVENGDVVLYQNINVRLTFADDSRSSVRRERAVPGQAGADAARVRALVCNPGVLSSYPEPAPPAPPTPGGFAPTPYPSLEGSPVEYLIITNDSLAATFQTLADFKTAKGVPTVVRTTEWIAANTRNGSDLAETMRNFVIDAYARWGIRYLLLGGDTDYVPTRLAWNGFYDGGRFLGVDMYFGALDGDWNADHDAIFGEALVDSVDLYNEVYVGRMPAKNNAEAALLISKVMNYERAVDAAYMKRSLFLGEVLFPPDYKPGDTVTLDGADLSEFIRTSLFTAPTQETEELYERNSLFPGSTHEDKPTAIDSLNAGFNNVIHIGHGFRFNVSVGNASIVNSEASALINGIRQSNVWFLNCTGCAFLYDCIGEALLRNPNGGAVSVIGANESAFPLTSINYMYAYYDMLNNQNAVHIGEAFALSRETRTPLALLGDNVDSWTHYIMTLLADPEMPLFTGPVAQASVSLPSGLTTGTNPVTVTVMASGSPVDSAVVCLSKGSDDYVVGTTDASGSVTVNFRAESAGSVGVVVTGLNLARWEGSVPVTVPGGSAYVSLGTVSADDDSTVGSAGNGDGVIDAGETVDLGLSVANTGNVASDTVDVVVSTSSPGVTLLDNTARVGVVAAGSTAVALDPVRVHFDAGIADQTTVTFTASIRNNGAAMWTDELKRDVHAPKLEGVSLRVDDTATGNGDGVVQAGEAFVLYYRVKNYGTGSSVPADVVITNLDGGFVMADSTDTYGAIATLAERENTSGWSLTEPDVSVPHRLEIASTDVYGRAMCDTVELRIPLPPDSIVIDPSLGPDRLELTWQASPSTDVAGYHVYRAQTPGGPYTRVDVDRVPHTLFVDQGLSAITRFYYVATAVDRSGNESAFSAEFNGSTGPPLLSGFPISLSSPTTSSVVVGDIDGDGSPEMVVGDDHVNAWHGNGVEILDGDNNAQTWGVLSSVGATFVSDIALARMDSKPGLEIVAASRDSQRVYVMDATGTLLPGWPQPVENPIRAGLCVGDVDGDGLFEVVAIDEGAVLYVWHANGTELIDGDANPLTPGVFARVGTAFLHSATPALVDLDGDGAREIVIGTQTDSLYAYHADTSVCPGFPVALGGNLAGSPVAGDINNDGMVDLVACDAGGAVRALHADGTPLWTRGITNTTFFSPSPALADVDGDGKLETFFPGSDGKLYGFDDNGSDLPGWPVTYSTITTTESSPIIADIDGDGGLDVILGYEDRFILAWHSNGSIVDGFPVTTLDAMRGVPCVADVDGDGDIDLLAAGWDGDVYVWDFAAPWNPALAPWPGFHGNAMNDGEYGSPVPTPVHAVQFSAVPGNGRMNVKFIVPDQGGAAFEVWRAPATHSDSGVARDFTHRVGAVSADADGIVRVVDTSVSEGQRYVYRLSSADGFMFDSRPVYIPVTRARLEQNAPNPFNPATTIRYTVREGKNSRVRLVVYDGRGRRVRTLVDALEAGGAYEAKWDGRDNHGQPVSSGIYFYRMTQPGFIATRKMLLLK